MSRCDQFAGEANRALRRERHRRDCASLGVGHQPDCLAIIVSKCPRLLLALLTA
jgi:hypothetical protein